MAGHFNIIIIELKRFTQIILYTLLAIFSIGISAQDHDVYLLANLCDVNDTRLIQKRLKSEIESRNTSSSIVLNGDLTSSPVWTAKGKQQLDELSEFLTSLDDLVEHIFILTGDRDWNDSQPQGYKAFKALNLELNIRIEENGLLHTTLLDKEGCPGPFDIYINNYIQLIAFQSQWWNHAYNKPVASDAICKYITDTDIAEEFNAIIADHDNKNILVVGHHPIRSLGNYGGRYSLAQNLKPFPIVGSFINAYKANIGNRYSIKNRRLKKYTYLLYIF